MTSRWIAKGRAFTPARITFFAARGYVPVRDALRNVDVLITAPHATAEIPEELRPFLDPRLSLREQFDFSDVSTRAIGRRWATIDERVVYLENPHPRLVKDPARPPPRDLEAGLRLAFRRVRRAGPGRVDLTGVDAVRPVTFAGRPVLLEPRDAAEWRELLNALRRCAAVGVDVYAATRDRLLNELSHHRPARGRHSMLHMINLHDTMAARIKPDGSITELGPAEERLPRFVSLGNLGDARGDPVQGAARTTTIPPAELRRIAAVFSRLIAMPPRQGVRHVAMNQVYTGGWETVRAAAILLATARASRMAHDTGRTGAYVAEFAREALLDPAALAILRQPGDDWPRQDPAHVDLVARRLKAAYDRIRAGGGADMMITYAELV